MSTYLPAHVWDDTLKQWVPPRTSASAAAEAASSGIRVLKDGALVSAGISSLGFWGVPVSVDIGPAGRANIRLTGAGPQIYTLQTAATGLAKAFGRNNTGQLGTGNTTNSATPVSVLAVSAIRSVACGALHTLYCLWDGTVWAVGNNDYGQLGLGDTTERHTPVQIPGLSGIVKVSAFNWHSLALAADGTVYAWGEGDNGRLGNGSTSDQTSPVTVTLSAPAVDIAAGYNHSLAALDTGEVWAWGYNGAGELGNGETSAGETEPVQALGITTATAVAAGIEMSLALLADGTVQGWGLNDFGQFGDGGTVDRDEPASIPGIAGCTGIAAGNNSAYFLLSSGEVWACGRGTVGQLGDGLATSSSVVVQVSGITTAVEVACGWLYGMARLTDGTVWTWGDNTYGVLGDGTTTQRNSPVQVSGVSDAGTMDGGDHHSAAAGATRALVQVTSTGAIAVVAYPGLSPALSNVGLLEVGSGLVLESAGAGRARISSAGAALTFADLGTGDDVTTTFTLPETPSGDPIVVVHGVTQRPAIDYTVSGADIIFGAAPASGLWVGAWY